MVPEDSLRGDEVRRYPKTAESVNPPPRHCTTTVASPASMRTSVGFGSPRFVVTRFAALG